MFRYLLFLAGILFSAPSSSAQGENNMWVFGYLNGLNFNVSPPAFYQTALQSIEGSASVADASGNLLFYSNGNKVWNAAQDIMLHGSDLRGNGPMASTGNSIGSSAQGVAIVRAPENSNRYYLFTQDALEDVNFNYPGYLRYSIVDMELNDGLGDVMAGIKNIVIDTSSGEQMTVAKGAGCYYWLIIHKRNSNQYHSFKIDAGGIHPPVTSGGYITSRTAGGQIKVSPDGRKILNTNSSKEGFELGEFNSATGVISHCIPIDTLFTDLPVGAAFSPDNSKIYIACYQGLLQYDISMFPDQAAIEASRILIHGGRPAQLRNGPDGKIYAGSLNSPFTGVINNPDHAGMACNFDALAYPQPSWSASKSIYWSGLGNEVVITKNETITHTAADTTLCDATIFLLSAPSGFQAYQWDNGATGPSRTITTSGRYWVKGIDGCRTVTDTVKVTFEHLAELGPDTAICPGQSIILNATGNNAHYLWQNGSTHPVFTVTESGTYSVVITTDHCSKTDSITVRNNRCDCVPFIPNAFSPNNDMLNDVFKVAPNCNVTSFTMNIYNRYGTRVFSSNDPQRSWDGYVKGKPADVGTYFYYMAFTGAAGETAERKGDVHLIR